MIKKEEQLILVVDWLIDQMKDHKVFCLEGELGAGKTTLVRFLASKLGIDDVVHSPTFSLVNEYRYKSRDGTEKILYHIDLYRLESIDEALGIGIEEYLESGNHCFIEWPAIIGPLLPDDSKHIQITTNDEGNRKIRILKKAEV